MMLKYHSLSMFLVYVFAVVVVFCSLEAQCLGISLRVRRDSNIKIRSRRCIRSWKAKVKSKRSLYLGQEENEPICQEAILDSLFFGCDTESSGFVKVSILIEYLSLAVTGDNVEFGGNFDDLSYLLDPEGKDIKVDIETYRKGMEDWIDGIRCQSYNEDIAEIQNSSTYNESAIRNMTQDNTSLGRSRNQGDCSMNNSSESVEGVGGDSPQKQDSWELVTKIEDLQLNNKRLVDHNAELSFQMENTEETNSQLLQELEKLRKQLRSYQYLDEKNKAIEKENEELRQTVIELQETSENVRNKAKQLERDKMTLNEFQEELQTKLAAARRRLDSLTNDHKSVCLAYNEEKQKLIELEELQGVKEEIDEVSTNRHDHLTNVIAELTRQKEALQMEKNKMEGELFEVREDLSRLMVCNAATVTPDRQNMYKTARKSFSTVNSLQQEIQELSCDDCLPSPLVGYSTFLSDRYETDVFESSRNSPNQTSSFSPSSLNSSLSSSLASKSSEVFTAAAQVAVDFREKKEKALHAISELVRLDKTRETKEIREDLQNELEKELEFFAEKIQLLSLARKAASKRASKHLASIEILKEENKQLLEERDKALQKAENLVSGSNDDLESKVESLMTELESMLKREETLEKRCGELQNQIVERYSELQCIKLENENLTSSVEIESNARKEAERKFKEFARLHNDIQKEHQNALAKIGKLEKEFERTSQDLNVEKKRSFDLQESLSLSVSKHEQELQDIMETIPDATYTDQEKLSKSPVITGYQVRSRLHGFLANKHLTIRDSPDGKPTTHEEESPVGVSTPLDRSTNSDLTPRRPPLQCQLTCISENRFNDNSKDYLDINTSLCCSWNSTESSETSIVSPNLIRPFEVDDESSPNLVHPFEGNRKTNLTYTKGGHETKELEEQLESNAVALNSFDGRDSQVNVQSLDNESIIESPARNLAQDFTVEVTASPTYLNRSASLSSGQYSNDDTDGRPPVPVSPLVPQRFLEFANVSPQRRHGVVEIPVVKTGVEIQELQDGTGDCSKNAVREKSMFSFDNLDIERCAEKFAEKCGVGATRGRRLNSSPCDGGSGDGVLEGYDSDYRSSPSIANSYIEGISFNSNLPSDENELQKLFKSVVLAFRTDKATLSQRLEFQERARDTAESNVDKGLQCLSSGLKSLEKIVGTDSNKQVVKNSLESLYQQIMLLKESSRRVSTQSHQFGCYQQEARMMSGVDVLITYGENLSQRFETLSESFNSKEPHEDHEDSLKAHGRKRSIIQLAEEVENNQSRRGSAFYSFMSSMRPKDGFGLFGGSAETSAVLKGSCERHERDQSSCVEENADKTLAKNTEEEQVFENIRNKAVKERSCFNRCLYWSLRLIISVILLGLFIFIGIEYSVIDRDFVFEQVHKHLYRFEVKLYGEEPAV